MGNGNNNWLQQAINNAVTNTAQSVQNAFDNASQQQPPEQNYIQNAINYAQDFYNQYANPPQNSEQIFSNSETAGNEYYKLPDNDLLRMPDNTSESDRIGWNGPLSGLNNWGYNQPLLGKKLSDEKFFNDFSGGGKFDLNEDVIPEPLYGDKLPNGLDNTAENREKYEEALMSDAMHYLVGTPYDTGKGYAGILNGEKPILSDADSEAVYAQAIKPISEKIKEEDENQENENRANFETTGDVIDRIIQNMNTYDYAEDRDLDQRRKNVKNQISEDNLENINELADIVNTAVRSDMYDKDNNFLIDTRAAPEAYDQMDRFNYYISNTPAGYKWAYDIDPELVRNIDPNNLGFNPNDPNNDYAFTKWRMAVKDLTDAGATGSWDDAMDRLNTDIWNSDESEDSETRLKRGSDGKLDKNSREVANNWMYDTANQFNLSEYMADPAAYMETPQYLNMGKQANAVQDFTGLMLEQLGLNPYEFSTDDLKQINTWLERASNGKSKKVANALGLTGNLDENGEEEKISPNEAIYFDANDLALYNLISLMQRGNVYSDEDINRALNGAIGDYGYRAVSDGSGVTPAALNMNDAPLPLLVPGQDPWYTPYVWDNENEENYEDPTLFNNLYETLYALNPDLTFVPSYSEDKKNKVKKSSETSFTNLQDIENVLPENYDKMSDEEKIKFLTDFSALQNSTPMKNWVGGW